MITGLQSNLDVALISRRHALPLVLGFLDSSLANPFDKAYCLKFLRTASELSCCQDLMMSCGAYSWLTRAIKQSRNAAELSQLLVVGVNLLKAREREATSSSSSSAESTTSSALAVATEIQQLGISSMRQVLVFASNSQDQSWRHGPNPLTSEDGSADRAALTRCLQQTVEIVLLSDRTKQSFKSLDISSTWRADWSTVIAFVELCVGTGDAGSAGSAAQDRAFVDFVAFVSRQMCAARAPLHELSTEPSALASLDSAISRFNIATAQCRPSCRETTKMLDLLLTWLVGLLRNTATAEKTQESASVAIVVDTLQCCGNFVDASLQRRGCASERVLSLLLGLHYHVPTLNPCARSASRSKLTHALTRVSTLLCTDAPLASDEVPDRRTKSVQGDTIQAHAQLLSAYLDSLSSPESVPPSSDAVSSSKAILEFARVVPTVAAHMQKASTSSGNANGSPTTDGARGNSDKKSKGKKNSSRKSKGKGKSKEKKRNKGTGAPVKRKLAL